ncbi:MAG: 4'-phosphopantetheinyl transferase superfamily protein [Proteobacteria bacterium]|nr:4'-phosphopantetheinyl transferase superfamily protein [Pseudomonadota bacterium]
MDRQPRRAMADMPQLIVHDLFELALFKNSASHQSTLVRLWLHTQVQSRSGGQLLETPTGPAFATGPWQISLSYSNDYAVCALSKCAYLGVDITPIQYFAELTEVAQLYFSPAIAQTLSQLPESEQALRFAKEWSELEAKTKACKMGLREWSEGREQAFQIAKTSDVVRLENELITVVWA